MEGDNYKKRKSSEFMPSLPIPGVKYPPGSNVPQSPSPAAGTHASPRSQHQHIDLPMPTPMSQRMILVRPPAPPPPPAAGSQTPARPHHQPSRVIIENKPRPNITDERTRNVRETHYAAPLNKEGLKVQIIVAKPKLNVGEPEELEQPSPTQTPEAEAEKFRGRSKSKTRLDYLGPTSNISNDDSKQDEIHSPELFDRSNLDRTNVQEKGLPNKSGALESLVDKNTIHPHPDPQNSNTASHRTILVRPSLPPPAAASPTPAPPPHHYRRVVIENKSRPKVTDEKTHNVQETHYAAALNKEGHASRKVEIIVAKPKPKVEIPSLPEELVQPLPTVKPESDFEKLRTKSKSRAPLDNLDATSKDDAKHTNIFSPKLLDESNVDSINTLNKGVPDQSRTLETLLDKDAEYPTGSNRPPSPSPTKSIYASPRSQHQQHIDPPIPIPMSQRMVLYRPPPPLPPSTASPIPLPPPPPHPKRVVVENKSLKITDERTHNFQETHYTAPLKKGIQIEIIVAKPKPKVEIPPLPPPEEIAQPTKAVKSISEFDKLRARSKSRALLDYLDAISNVSHDDSKHDNVPSPELLDDSNVDVINVLKKFGIPDQARALESLLDKDTVHYDFGGLMRQYYSYVLRSYCLINMQDRYRGVSSSSNCYTSVDISSIGTRDEEMGKYTKAKLRRLDDKREKLRSVAVDDDHYNYLKNLANNQATLLPLTIVHVMNEQMAPVLEDVFRFYGKNLGTSNKCTKVAGYHYIKMRKRVAMYNYICGGSTLNEDLTPYYK